MEFSTIVLAYSCISIVCLICVYRCKKIFKIRPTENTQNNNYEVLICYTDSITIITQKIWFLEEADFNRFCAEYVDGSMIRTRNGVPRHLAVIVNPISGKGRAVSYYENILEPMLKISGLKFTRFTTESPTYVSDLVSSFNYDELEFTEFIMIGGDGILNQFINAVGVHPQKDQLFKLPIGIMPGGSTNATACDLNGKDPFLAAVNCVRGHTIQGDILKVHLKRQDLTLYTSTISWGIVSDIVNDAQAYRKCFGSCRYTACGIKQFC